MRNIIDFIAKKKKSLTLICTSLLAGILAFGGTTGMLAYQTDKETMDNIVTVGEVKIGLTETQWPNADVPGNPPVENILGNQEISKNPVVQNTGINDAVVFLKVTVPVVNATAVNADKSKDTTKKQEVIYFKLNGDDASTHQNHFNSNWIELPTEETGTDLTGTTRTYVFGYNKRIQGGDKTDGSTTGPTSTDALFDKIQLKSLVEGSIPSKTQENIKLEAYAIQADNIIDGDAVMDTSGTLTLEKLNKIYSIYVNQDTTRGE